MWIQFKKRQTELKERKRREEKREEKRKEEKREQSRRDEKRREEKKELRGRIRGKDGQLQQRNEQKWEKENEYSTKVALDTEAWVYAWLTDN